VRVNNGFCDAVIDLQFQPSLSSVDGNESPCCSTSAFLLQVFLKPGVVVGSCPDSFPWIKMTVIVDGRTDSKVASAYIYSYDVNQRFGSR
jgi:hypothetical protein